MARYFINVPKGAGKVRRKKRRSGAARRKARHGSTQEAGMAKRRKRRSHARRHSSHRRRRRSTSVAVHRNAPRAMRRRGSRRRRNPPLVGRALEIIKGAGAVSVGRIATRLGNHYVTPRLAGMVPAGAGATMAALAVQVGSAVAIGMLAGAALGHEVGADVMKGGLSEPIVEGLKVANIPVLSEGIAAYPMAAYPRSLAAYPAQRALGAGAPGNDQRFPMPVIDDDDDDDD